MTQVAPRRDLHAAVAAPQQAQAMGAWAAQQALGDDIGPAYTGMSCGNAERSGSTGHASWSMPIKGSRGRAASVQLTQRPPRR